MNWRTAQGSALEIPQLQRPRRGRRRRYHFPGFKVEVSAARCFKVTETERADLLYLVPFLLSIRFANRTVGNTKQVTPQ